MNTPDPQPNFEKRVTQNQKLDEFEKELDEFFKERALFRAATFSDKFKRGTSSHRDSSEDTEKNELTEISLNMSGCCMTGCHDCPWGYTAS